jgi:hypothetical protein
MPQPTAPPRAPIYVLYTSLLFELHTN